MIYGRCQRNISKCQIRRLQPMHGSDSSKSSNHFRLVQNTIHTSDQKQQQMNKLKYRSRIYGRGKKWLLELAHMN